jgi:hypothetical protein
MRGVFERVRRACERLQTAFAQIRARIALTLERCAENIA